MNPLVQAGGFTYEPWRFQMELVEPLVYLVAKPELDYDTLEDYLEEVGGEQWLVDRKPRLRTTGGQPGNDTQNLVEAGGRLCYRSWKPGLNPNVSRVRKDQGAYLENILASGHGSVLEHANFTFLLKDVSRVTTHEIVRHRAGSAFSQESLRFVRLDELAMWMPEWAQEDEKLFNFVLHYAEAAEKFQQDLAVYLGLDEKGVDFGTKKKLTSFMRRFAPEGLATSIMWTANVRTLRHVIEQRTAKGAEEEIRLVFGQIAQVMQAEAPLLFGDFEEDDGEWVPKHRKV